MHYGGGVGGGGGGGGVVCRCGLVQDVLWCNNYLSLLPLSGIMMGLLMLSLLGLKVSADNILKHFYFSQKIDFDISCKLPPTKEAI